jgi:integrase
MLAAVFMAAAGERDAIMWMAILGVLSALGVRRESIIRLKTSDVVLQGNVLNLRMFIPKKRGDYYVDYAIPTDLVLGGVHIGQILEAYHKFRLTEPEGYYFYTSDSQRPISPSYLSNKIRAIGQKAGVRLQPTDFRRYALNRIATVSIPPWFDFAFDAC